MNILQKEELEILKYFDNFTERNNLSYILYAGTLLGAVRHKGFIPWDDDIDVAMKREEYEKFEKLFINSDYREKGFNYQSRKIYPYQAIPFSKIRSKQINVIERVSKTQKGYYGPWIDIFPYDNIPDDPEKRLEQYKKVNFYNTILKKFLLIQIEPEDKGVKKIVKKIVRNINENLYRSYFFLEYVFRKREEWLKMYNDIETTHSADISYMYHKNYQEYSGTFIKNKDFKNLKKMDFEDRMFYVPKNYDEILTNLYGNYMKIPEKSERKEHKIEYLV